MRPRIGDPAPDFEKRSDDGRLIRLADLRGRWVVLFFYPRASSLGCSVEAQRFEAAVPAFEGLGAEVIGVSTDTEARQASFRDSCTLSFPLLPDSDRSVCRAYGVMGGLGGLLGVAARETFLIDPQGTLAGHYRSANPGAHASAALSDLQRLQGRQATGSVPA